MTTTRPYRAALDRVDCARDGAGGFPLGLRDGAILALADAGVLGTEMVGLEARAVRQVTSGEHPELGVSWRTDDQRHVVVRLDAIQGGWVLAYLDALGARGTRQPLIQGVGGGALTFGAVYAILRDYVPSAAAPAARRSA